jgi:pyridoxamine 5'-phosphate oxidase
MTKDQPPQDLTGPDDWAQDLASFYQQAWTRLVRGVADRRAPSRHPTLATVSPAGWPEARTVVLRAADPVLATLEIHTDLKSPKVASLRANNCATLHIWEQSAHLQIRIEATVTILTGENVAPIWAKVPDPSRQSYGTMPTPGTPIDAALAYKKPADQTSFAVLRCAAQAIDLLHLGPDHRRARFERLNDWQGQWLAP